MYRAVTWWMLRHGVDVHDPAAVASRCEEPRIESGTDPSGPTITVDGEDVAVEIRGDDVNAAVSPVSTVPRVRARMQVMQRQIIEAAIEDRDGGIVVEGRDIGSVVWPDATVKVYLSADPAARAQRRAAEQGASDVEATREALLARDEIDSGRAVSPLVLAEGAVHVDTTDLTLDEAIDTIVAMVAHAHDGVSAP
jgi:cytidylate kinase